MFLRHMILCKAVPVLGISASFWHPNFWGFTCPLCDLCVAWNLKPKYGWFRHPKFGQHQLKKQVHQFFLLKRGVCSFAYGAFLQMWVVPQIIKSSISTGFSIITHPFWCIFRIETHGDDWGSLHDEIESPRTTLRRGLRAHWRSALQSPERRETKRDWQVPRRLPWLGTTRGIWCTGISGQIRHIRI